MNFSALLLMIFVQGSIAAITFYLFYRVLTSGKNNQRDESEIGDNDKEISKRNL